MAICQEEEKNMKFEPKSLDYKLSPYTGLTRESWLEAGIYMLEGSGGHIEVRSGSAHPRQAHRI